MSVQGFPIHLIPTQGPLCQMRRDGEGGVGAAVERGGGGPRRQGRDSYEQRWGSADGKLERLRLDCSGCGRINASLH